MRMIVKIFFFVLISLPIGNAALAAPCTTEQIDACGAGKYCEETTEGCTKCPDTHPSSDSNENMSKTSCYKDCPEKTNGPSKWDQEKIPHPSDKACYTDISKLNCPSKTFTKTLPAGQSSDELICRNVFASRTSDGHGNCEYEWRDQSSVPFVENWKWTTTCYVRSCDSGWHRSGLPDNTPGHVCISNEQNCTYIDVGLSGVSGQATWVGSWNSGSYNKSKCCKTATSLTIENGSGTDECCYSGGTVSSPLFMNCSSTATACDAGYYGVKNAQNLYRCAPTTAGHFSTAADGLAQKDCPGGTTSESQATKKQDCYIKGGTTGTKFCENDETTCFTLPDGIKIYYKGS